MLPLVFDHVLPAYRRFHESLLFHQKDEAIFRPLLVGRVCEAVLAQGSPWNETDRITAAAIKRLNDYVGYRPVPVLQDHRHHPYPHEWIRPVPLYIEGAGIGVGRYHDVVKIAMEIVRDTDRDLLRVSHLDPDMLTELAFDPRAYDFDHPANKRPNYHFGQWDPNCIDNNGHYRRLVLQQVTLDALMQRVEQPGELPPDEALFEGGAVLAGVMLMSTGVSGWGPGAYDSDVSLGNLLPIIAGYRDEFYKQLLTRTRGPHARRLKAEAKRQRQAFAEARQHLNATLTRVRAAQVGHVQLAKVFSRMGFVDAARKHAEFVPSTSARLMSQIDCQMTAAQRALEERRAEAAVERLSEVEKLLRKGIECGAIIDPWNILGFDAHFSLFPTIENSIRDFRADDLAALVEQMLQRYAGAWCAAAAADDGALCARVEDQMRRLAEWWHQFAAHEVSSIEAPHAPQAFDAARHVADILAQWHQSGAAGGDVAFWAPHAAQFDSPKAYATVIASLLDRGDFVASMGLLVHWLSRAEETGLEQGESSFAALAIRWLRQLQHTSGSGSCETSGVAGTLTSSATGPINRWALTRRLFDLFEANAESYADAPQFLLGEATVAAADDPFEDSLDDDEDEEESLFDAAYEDVVFRDSTDDGFEGDILDYGQPSEDELEAELRRINLRLGFHVCLAQLWKLAACRQGDAPPDQRREALHSWLAQAQRIGTGLNRLMEQVARHRVQAGGVDCDSLMEFDRQQTLQEVLLERITAAQVEVADAAFFILAAANAAEETIGSDFDWPVAMADDERLAVSLMAALLRHDRREAQARCAEYLDAVVEQPILYVPISRGGESSEVVEVRKRQRVMQNLAFALPRVGLLGQTRAIVEAARRMERDHPVGPGAVTEFDDLFETAYRAMVDCVISSAQTWRSSAGRQHADELALFTALEQITHPMSKSWNAHSRTLRLSVLERVADEKAWGQIVRFIRRYGGDLFTQHFLNLGNLRAIHHQGVEEWLEQLEEEVPPGQGPKLLDDLGGPLSMRRAVKCLSLILEAIAENYVEYRDYNATRTESDRGEMLYKLLDFLRLRVAYDRIAWRYRPVMITHETLLRRGHPQAAELWRRGLAKSTHDEADSFQNQLVKLQEEHAMKMPTIGERLAERFVQPTTIHRLRSLVEPAMDQHEQGSESTYFSLLEQEASVMVRECGGVGLDVPAWLLALEDEVERVRRPVYEREEQQWLADALGQVCFTSEEFEQLLNGWTD